ncbi:MAG: SGNH/GDSL hydrolase family protein [Phycisphaerales bacterium]
MLTRRSLLASSFAAGLLPRTILATGLRRSATADLVWHNPEMWGVEGKGWATTERFYDRLPASAAGVVPKAVWELSHHSAGMFVSFTTDAAEIHVRYSLSKSRIAMPDMAATGVSGFDLYARDGARWRWVSVFKPTEQRCEGPLAESLDPGTRDYRLYLPLYNGVDSLEIGVPPSASFTPISPRAEKPVVLYGTSILHGAAASRPGMAWPSILGRRIDLPTVNLGFSGSGKMEKEVAALVAEIDAAAYVIDCAPNMNAKQITERAGPLVECIRAARPSAPILLVEDRRYGYAWVKGSSRDRNEQNAKALAAVYADLVARGVKGLAYVPASALLGDEPEETMTDGSHPSDLGMMLYAKAVAPVLASAMGRLLPC